jgi:hypothetical protein
MRETVTIDTCAAQCSAKTAKGYIMQNSNSNSNNSNKTYTFGGWSTLKGAVKVRLANDAKRVKVLERNGHTDIVLFELGTAMSKEEAVAHVAAVMAERGIIATVEVAETAVA